MPIRETVSNGLDNEHQHILDHRSGFLLLNGEPGTSKTTLLIRWVTSLIASQLVKPQEVLVLTCTNRAVMDMRERFILQLGEQAAQIPIFTFSAFCLSLLTGKKSGLRGIYFREERSKLLQILHPELVTKDIMAIDKVLTASFPALWEEQAGKKQNMLRNSLHLTKEKSSIDTTGYQITGQNDEQLRVEKQLAVEQSFYPPDEQEFKEPEKTANMPLGPLLTGKKSVSDLVKENSFIQLRADYLAVCEQAEVIDRDYLPVKLGTLCESDRRFLNYLQSRYRYIALDDFQEICLNEYRLLKYLFNALLPVVNAELPHHYKGALITGNLKATVCSRRTEPQSVFLDFLKDYKSQIYTCSKNYRSAPVIVRAARVLADHLAVAALMAKLPVSTIQSSGQSLTEADTQMINSGLPGTGFPGSGKTGSILPQVKTAPPADTIKIFNAKNALEEIRFVITMIEELAQDFRAASSPVGSLKGNYTYPQVAVLYRQEPLGQQALPYFESAGIPVAYKANSRTLSTRPFKHVLSILRLLVNPRDVVALNDVFHALLDSFKKQPLANNLLLDYLKSGESLLVVFEGYQQRGLLTENSLLEIEEFIGFMGLLRTTIDSLDLAAGLELIFDKYIKLPNDTSEHLEKRLIKSALLETANWFRRDIRGFVQFVTTQEYESDGFSAPPGINFLTFAAAKGYEFPVVFIIGAEEGITPVTSAESDMEEERRLFYLAMTRAKEKLFISSAAKREMSGRILKLLPSRFLHDLPETATDILVVQKKTKKLLYEQLPLF